MTIPNRYLRALAAFYIRLTFDAIDIYETLEPMLDDYRKLRYRAMGEFVVAIHPLPSLRTSHGVPVLLRTISLLMTFLVTHTHTLSLSVPLHSVNPDGSYSIVTMDEFVDQLLREERVCEVQLPRVTMRKVLEESEGLPRRRSQLAQVMGIEGYDDDDDEEGSDGEDGRGRYLSRSPSLSGSERGRYVSRSPSRSGSEGGRSRRSRSRSESSSRSGSPDDRDRYISRSPSPAGYVSRSPTRSPEPEGEVQTAMPVDH